MKITIEQLKELIKEQVEEASRGGYPKNKPPKKSWVELERERATKSANARQDEKDAVRRAADSKELKRTGQRMRNDLEEQVDEGFFDEGDDEAIQIARGKLTGAIFAFEKAVKVASKLNADEQEINMLKDIVNDLKQTQNRVVNLISVLEAGESKFLK